MNLLQETVKAINKSGHTVEQIMFIGSPDTGHQCTWQEFEKLADVEYDDVEQEVINDLIIAFRWGGYLKRIEYDGKRFWCYCESFKIPYYRKPIKHLIRDGWVTLKELDWDIK